MGPSENGGKDPEVVVVFVVPPVEGGSPKGANGGFW